MQIHNEPGTNISIHVIDAPSHGGAHHNYEVRGPNGQVLLTVAFQHGPVNEHGINGVQHCHLLRIVEHRLDCFQRGPFASAVNEVTAGFVGAAIAADGTRTRRRELAGTEGTSKV